MYQMNRNKTQGSFKQSKDINIDYNMNSDFVKKTDPLKKGVSHRRKVAQQIYRFLYGMGAPVDIIVETPEKFEELKDNPFMIYKEISKSGKVVYEK